MNIMNIKVSQICTCESCLIPASEGVPSDLPNPRYEGTKTLQSNPSFLNLLIKIARSS